MMRRWQEVAGRADEEISAVLDVEVDDDAAADNTFSSIPCCLGILSTSLSIHIPVSLSPFQTS